MTISIRVYVRHLVLSVVMLSVIMVNAVLLSAVMLSVIMLNVVMLSVVAPLYCISGHNDSQKSVSPFRCSTLG